LEGKFTHNQINRYKKDLTGFKKPVRSDLRLNGEGVDPLIKGNSSMLPCCCVENSEFIGT